MGVVSRLGGCYVRWVWSLGVVSRLGSGYVWWVWLLVVVVLKLGYQ